MKDSKDIIVSIRMPKSLVAELKKLVEKNHFLDLSEELRSIARKKCLEYRNPYAEQLKELKTELKTELEHKEKSKQKQQLVDDLKKIVDELKNEK